MSYRLRNFVIAAVLALLAGILTTMYVSSYKHRVQRGEQLVPVLVATKDVPSGTPSAKLSFAERKVQQRNVVTGAISDKRRLAGLVSQSPIFAGEQVTMRRFASVSALGPRGAIHGQMRVVALPGDSNQLLSGVLRPGDRVDVVAALPPRTSSTSVKPSVVLLKNVLVLRAAQQTSSTGTKLGSTGTDQKLSVLLSLADKDAQKLFFAMENGDWTLALRPIDGSAR
jgi:pilus assembly protein CpaB